TYEHIEPSLVGNQRVIVTSNQSGRANLRATLHQFGIDLKDDAQNKLLQDIKQLESDGFSYDGAQASLELLIRKFEGKIIDYFNIERFRVIDERRYNALGEFVCESEANVTVRLKNTCQENQFALKIARGNGPVNALDQALRLALIELFPILQNVALSDYKVRILPPSHQTSGTQAITRVTIESFDQSMSWSTVGVSTNVIEASVQALSDSYIWYLYKNKQK
ncbi:MAG: alpha-isopropylmalate synthase regulatory domain-containing protein, partial [Pseudomonadota bacterium]